jgi:hypothetical protein
VTDGGSSNPFCIAILYYARECDAEAGVIPTPKGRRTNEKILYNDNDNFCLTAAEIDYAYVPDYNDPGRGLEESGWVV